MCVRATACMEETPCVEATPCMDEAPCVTEAPGMRETPCVSGVVASVPGCVLPSTPCMSETPCARETARVCEQPRVSERPSVRETACVRSLHVREMTVGMREHAAASPGVSVMSWCMSVVTRRCACVEWRRRLRQLRDKGRVAAVAISGTAPGLHGGEREVRAVQRMRPPHARLRE